jgi:hypothetical protein
MSKYAEMAKGKLSEGREKASGLKGRAKGKVVRRRISNSHLPLPLCPQYSTISKI